MTTQKFIVQEYLPGADFADLWQIFDHTHEKAAVEWFVRTHRPTDIGSTQVRVAVAWSGEPAQYFRVSQNPDDGIVVTKLERQMAC